MYALVFKVVYKALESNSSFADPAPPVVPMVVSFNKVYAAVTFANYFILMSYAFINGPDTAP